MPEIRINENIRKYRKEMGIGQEALANALGVTIQAVSKWETSGSMPDIMLLPQIAEFFGVTLEELFYGREDNGPQLVVQPIETAKESSSEADTENVAPETESAAESDSETGEHQQATEEDHSYTWNDLSDLGKTIGSSISEQVRRFTEGVRENVSGLNLHFKLGNDRWAEENKVRSDLPDDQILRVVQFYGNEIVQADEVSVNHPIQLAVPDPDQQPRKVIIYGNADITGSVGGSVTADGSVQCGNVGGSVQSDGSVNCQSVGGNVTSDGNVQCSVVNGNVTTDGNITCGNVMGSVTADGNVSCGSVRGSVRCDGKVYMNS